MRTIVDLPLELVSRLDFVASRDRISRAEAVRRAIEAAYPPEHAEQLIRTVRRQAYGLWKERADDAARYVDTLRDEWER
jgi:metal-responsive CopG/Arc/MetJ family transcriptional regulator